MLEDVVAALVGAESVVDVDGWLTSVDVLSVLSAVAVLSLAEGVVETAEGTQPPPANAWTTMFVTVGCETAICITDDAEAEAAGMFTFRFGLSNQLQQLFC